MEIKKAFHGYAKIGPVVMNQPTKREFWYAMAATAMNAVIIYALRDPINTVVSAVMKKCGFSPKSSEEQDPELIGKQMDGEVKDRVSRLLGLFDTFVPTMSSFGGKTKHEVEYLVDKTIKLGDRLVVVSPPGQGKSLWVTQVAICIAQGLIPEFLDKSAKPCKPQKVILYDAEQDDDDMSSRYGDLPVIPNLNRLVKCRFRTMYYLLESIYNNVIGVGDDCTIILDNLFALMPGMTTEETRTFLDGLDVIQRKIEEQEHKLTYIIVSHTVKDVRGVPGMDDVAGSAHVSRFAKSIMAICKLPGDDNLSVLVTSKRRYAPEKTNILMRVSNDGYTHFEYAGKITYDELLDRMKSKGAIDGNAESSKRGYDDDVQAKIFQWHTEDDPISFRNIAQRLREEGIEISHTEVRKQYRSYCEANGIDPYRPRG